MRKKVVFFLTVLGIVLVLVCTGLAFDRLSLAIVANGIPVGLALTVQMLERPVRLSEAQRFRRNALITIGIALIASSLLYIGLSFLSAININLAVIYAFLVAGGFGAWFINDDRFTAINSFFGKWSISSLFGAHRYDPVVRIVNRITLMITTFLVLYAFTLILIVSVWIGFDDLVLGHELSRVTFAPGNFIAIFSLGQALWMAIIYLTFVDEPRQSMRERQLHVQVQLERIQERIQDIEESTHTTGRINEVDRHFLADVMLRLKEFYPYIHDMDTSVKQLFVKTYQMLLTFAHREPLAGPKE